ncbi:periplasmic chaperone for outer membrane proteins SurA [Pedobacter psychrotolerans]|uniref:Peptidylprolyl isomerase n=1 Tax=Pedobacter psychrotolerans TaxID=1843235 RepID=A0A4R2HJ37_9SPHI|nr:peptidylprolyl isomerase [Pedobacter psychrotolerans]TCO29057.1 periplasmic chaperone for outer membrane proteins SurA [Pedobacter psychrotolerans]GGE53811.1 peptidylprolyl isomerase [Pedobacter psychrotolerans]
MKKVFLVATALICLFLNSYAQPGKHNIDKVAAVVGNNIILLSDLNQQYTQYLYQGNPANEDIKCKILQNTLTQKLLKQQAEIDSVMVEDGQVDDEVNKRMRYSMQRAGGQERLEQFLNKSVLQYKDEIRPSVKDELIAQKMQAKITENINVTPMEVEKYFKTLGDSIPEFNTEVEVGEIILDPKLTKAEKQRFHDKIEALRLRVKGGDDFGVLAKTYSEDPGSSADGGDLGFFDRSTMAKEFTAWAFKLKAGEMSPVFETEFGFHILQVIERRGEQVHARHILVRPATTPESLTRLKLHADSIYNKILSKKISFAAAASLYSDNKETKFNGGMMLNAENVQARSTFIPIDKLDPSVFLVIDTMKIGAISKPNLYTAADGKQAYRILYLKSKIPPHKANLAQDFPKIRDAAQSDKINRTLSEWFEKRRESTYIKIDDEFNTCNELKIWTKTSTAAK